jgi:hypothetical protein
MVALVVTSKPHDPIRVTMSPMLFNIMTNILTIMIGSAKNLGRIARFVFDGGLSILQYVDDTILFMKHDSEKDTNMKLILLAFDQLFGLKIIFHKRDLFCLSFPLKYTKLF